MGNARRHTITANCLVNNAAAATIGGAANAVVAASASHGDAILLLLLETSSYLLGPELPGSTDKLLGEKPAGVLPGLVFTLVEATKAEDGLRMRMREGSHGRPRTARAWLDHVLRVCCLSCPA